MHVHVLTHVDYILTLYHYFVCLVFVIHSVGKPLVLCNNIEYSNHLCAQFCASGGGSIIDKNANNKQTNNKQ